MPGAPLRRSSVESDAARRLLLVADGLLSAGSADDVVLVHAIAADAYGPDQASAPEERNAPGENLQAVGETGYARATVVRHSLLDEGLKEHFPHELQLQPVVEDAEAGDRPRVRTVLRSVYAVGEEGTAEEADCPVAEGDRTVQPDAVARSALDRRRSCTIYRWEEAVLPAHVRQHRPLHTAEVLGSEDGGWAVPGHDLPDPTQRVK